MRIPILTALPNTPASTAARAVQITHGNLYVSLGVALLAVWFVLHRFAAHRHPIVEAIARAFLAAAGVALAVSVGVIAKWVANVNDLTARWLTNWTGDPHFANNHLGLLTVLAFVDVAFAVAVLVDLFNHFRANGLGASGRPKRHPRWGAMEESFNKWGWFGLGPLAATLPARLGLTVMTLLMLLTEWLTHLIGPYVGLA